MTSSQLIHNMVETAPDEDVLAVYGKPDGQTDSIAQLAAKRKDFQAWHHPVKQIVRTRQWAALTQRLIESRPIGAPKILRYFTLPGPDLLDVCVLSDACEPLGVSIEYFGFNDGSGLSGDDDSPSGMHAPWITAESRLRQAGRITSDAVIHSDRLEDIALTNSHAAAQLMQRPSFDVINIDACDHLAYSPRGRQQTTFDALKVLLQHQMHARTPWLLFVTTRAEPGLLGQPVLAFQKAIYENLGKTQSGFGKSLADCLAADEHLLATELATQWNARSDSFLKLFAVGFGKFLLQFFHGQPNLPANVELASTYAYRVYGETPDMLALAFRVTPDPVKVFPPSAGGASPLPDLEPARAVKVASQAAKLQDLDAALEKEDEVRRVAIEGTKSLLSSANFDLDEWKKWLGSHPQRPLVI